MAGTAKRTASRRRKLFMTVLALLCLMAATAAQRRSFYGWDESVRNLMFGMTH